MCAIEYYTYEDYKQWEGKWELIAGVPLAMAPAPVRKHQALAAKIIRQIDEQLDECAACEVLGEANYKICDDTVLRPDVVLICNEPNDTYLTKAPEIAFEIISPATAKRDEKYKFEIYEKELVKYYVLVYPDDLIAKIYKNEQARYIKQGDFSFERYDFEQTTCKVSIDFDKLFKKFRTKN